MSAQASSHLRLLRENQRLTSQIRRSEPFQEMIGQRLPAAEISGIKRQSLQKIFKRYQIRPNQYRAG